MDQISSRQKNCPNCGSENLCQSQQLGDFNCWCQGVDLSDENRVKIKALGFSAECLCQQCLELLSKKMS